MRYVAAITINDEEVDDLPAEALKFDHVKETDLRGMSIRISKLFDESRVVRLEGKPKPRPLSTQPPTGRQAHIIASAVTCTV